ncbi:MAG: hypothetical protein ACYCQL_09685, partial [Acidithiobacillus sp.]
ASFPAVPGNTRCEEADCCRVVTSATHPSSVAKPKGCRQTPKVEPGARITPAGLCAGVPSGYPYRDVLLSPVFEKFRLFLSGC